MKTAISNCLTKVTSPPARTRAALVRIFGLLVALSVATAPVAARAGNSKTAAALDHVKSANVLYKLGRFAEAAAELENAYKLDPHPNLLFNLGQAYRHAGDPVKALEHYKRYLAEWPMAKDRAQVERLIRDIEEAPPRSTAAPEVPKQDVPKQDVPKRDFGAETNAPPPPAAALANPTAPTPTPITALPAALPEHPQSAIPPASNEPRPPTGSEPTAAETFDDIDALRDTSAASDLRLQQSRVQIALHAGGLLPTFTGSPLRPGAIAAFGLSLMSVRRIGNGFGEFGIHLRWMPTPSSSSRTGRSTNSVAHLLGGLLAGGWRFSPTDGLTFGGGLGAGALLWTGLATGNVFTSHGQSVSLTPVLCLRANLAIVGHFGSMLLGLEPEVGVAVPTRDEFAPNLTRMNWLGLSLVVGFER